MCLSLFEEDWKMYLCSLHVLLPPTKLEFVNMQEGRKYLTGAILTSWDRKEFIPCRIVRTAIEEALGKAFRNTCLLCLTNLRNTASMVSIHARETMTSAQQFPNVTCKSKPSIEVPYW